MQGLRHPLGDGLEQRPGFGKCSGLLAQFDQNAVRAVGLAEEFAVDPVRYFGREPPLQKKCRHTHADDAKLIHHPHVLMYTREDHTDHNANHANLEDSHSAAGECILQANAESNSQIHGALDHNHVGERQREDWKQYQRDRRDRLRHTHEHVISAED